LTPSRPSPSCPWEHIEPDGSNLSVEDFLSVPVVRIAAHLRRFPGTYTGGTDLTLPQWRLLSTVAHHQSIPFKLLIEVSANDKALVSRTIKELAAKGLVKTEPMKIGKALSCNITRKGARLVDGIMPQARLHHARLLLSLSKEDRVQLHGLLQKLQAVCDGLD